MRRPTRKRLVLLAIALLVLAIPVVGLAWLGGPPWLANHYGFALPGADGLPYRIHYHGRDYATQGYCAGASWCQGQRRTCDALQQIGRADALSHVADVASLLGPSYPVYALITEGFTTVILYVQTGSCYVPYALEGGP